MGPPVGHIYVSQLDDEKCFACELADDSMSQLESTPSFKRRDIVIFSITARVEDGDLAYVKSKDGDEFRQVFLEEEDTVRFHPLNGRYRERTVHRFEIRNMCKLRARFHCL